MKIVLLILFVTSLVSCESNYQNNKTDLTPKQLAGRDIRDATSNENSLVQNMQLYLDYAVILKIQGGTDALTDYNKLYETKADKAILTVRENLYTQFKNTNYDDFNKDEKTAFLINAYNFFAIETVIGNYYKDGVKINSITEIGPFPFYAFDNINYNVAGREMSLDAIEKRTLNPLLTHENGTIDARYHFAVICAANGCPILLKEAYDSKKIDAQLTYATQEGLKVKRNLTTGNGVLKLTQLFEWYVSDFENHSTDESPASGNIRTFLKTYASTRDLSGKLEYTIYDWNLNIIKL